MKPIPIKLLCSPWVAGFMLPADDTDEALAQLIRNLEQNNDDGPGMFRPIPLDDIAAYAKAAADALAQLHGAKLEDPGRVIIVDAEGARRALRLVQRLTN